MILKLRSERIEDVMEIWFNTNKEMQSFLPLDYWKEKYDIFKHGVLSNAETYIYEEADELLGFVCIQDGNYISNLVVKNTAQGRGIGTELLSYCMDNYRNLNISVYAQNEKGMAFLNKNGFEEHIRQSDPETDLEEIIFTWEK